MSFYRILLSQQMEASLCLHWLIGEWISCQSCLSNSTLSLALSVYSFSLCILVFCIFNFFYDYTLCYFVKCNFVTGSPLFLDLWVILALLPSLRTWDCPQHEAGVAVKTHPVTICIRTDTNLQCALNVAVSWPRRTPREQRWKFTLPRDFWGVDTVRLFSSCISHLLTPFMCLTTTLNPWAVSS